MKFVEILLRWQGMTTPTCTCIVSSRKIHVDKFSIVGNICHPITDFACFWAMVQSTWKSFFCKRLINYGVAPRVNGPRENRSGLVLIMSVSFENVPSIGAPRARISFRAASASEFFVFLKLDMSVFPSSVSANLQMKEIGWRGQESKRSGSSCAKMKVQWW